MAWSTPRKQIMLNHLKKIRLNRALNWTNLPMEAFNAGHFWNQSCTFRILLPFLCLHTHTHTPAQVAESVPAKLKHSSRRETEGNKRKMWNEIRIQVIIRQVGQIAICHRCACLFKIKYIVNVEMANCAMRQKKSAALVSRVVSFFSRSSSLICCCCCCCCNGRSDRHRHRTSYI